MILSTDPEKMLESHRMITDYLLTGYAPPGVRPEVLELCADIIAMTPPKFRPRLGGYTHRVERRGKLLALASSFQAAADYAKWWPSAKVKTNLRIIK